MAKINMQKYDSLLYKSGPVTFTEFVTGKYDKVHSQLYHNALQGYLKDHPEIMLYRSAYNFVEDQQPEYWQPSYVNIISKRYPYTKQRIWLDKYWCKYEENKRKTNKFSYINIDEDTAIDAQLKYLNYVTGEATLKSKLTGVEFNVPFNRIGEDTPLSDDYTLANSFVNLLKINRN